MSHGKLSKISTVGKFPDRDDGGINRALLVNIPLFRKYAKKNSD